MSPSPPQGDLKAAFGSVQIPWMMMTGTKDHAPLGYMTPAALATGPGMFGPATDRATRRFQQAVGLLVDGIIGPKTWKVLLA